MPDIAVVIPCYRVGGALPDVLRRIGPEVGWIFVVDDACPEQSAHKPVSECGDPRVRLIQRAHNGGVGAATMDGYRAALTCEARVVVKLDGDGQMPPEAIPRLVKAILSGQADYVKGNRFHQLRDTAGMPKARLFGNAALSFMTKLSSGYWQLFDPVNGFTAIHRDVLARVDLDRVATRYYFESDLLCHLNLLRAKVVEMPMQAHYGDETSSLQPMRMIVPFFAGNLRNLVRRLLYNYYLRGFSPASVELLLGLPLMLFGVIFGAMQWAQSALDQAPATAGTVMLAALPIIVGTQLLVGWLNFDIAAEPRDAVYPFLTGFSEGLDNSAVENRDQIRVQEH